MKTLTLLRHAKSGWDDPVLRDFDRPLNAKGQRAARAVGRHLRSLGVDYDHAVASPARRVVETLAEVEAGFGRALAPVWDRRAYLASPATLLDIVHTLPPSAERALLIGHNPGLEELVLVLVPAGVGAAPLRDDVEIKFPTASVAELAFEVDAWSEVAASGARLVRFVRPRDLDSSLGPDAD